MSKLPEVVIIIARCSREKQMYGMRFEKNEQGVWAADWAFPIQESVAKREGYDKGEIKGSFVIGPSYPGCPYCRAMSIFKCGCESVACWNGETNFVTCPWCNSSGELSGSGITSLKADGDR